jgi:hypothetical protein
VKALKVRGTRCEVRGTRCEVRGYRPYRVYAMTSRTFDRQDIAN